MKRTWNAVPFAFNDVNPLFVPAGSTRCLCVCARLFATHNYSSVSSSVPGDFMSQNILEWVAISHPGFNSHLLGVFCIGVIVLLPYEPPGKPGEEVRCV